jgi:hypothetical protein
MIQKVVETSCVRVAPARYGCPVGLSSKWVAKTVAEGMTTGAFGDVGRANGRFDRILKVFLPRRDGGAFPRCAGQSTISRRGEHTTMLRIAGLRLMECVRLSSKMTSISATGTSRCAAKACASPSPSCLSASGDRSSCLWNASATSISVTSPGRRSRLPPFCPAPKVSKRRPRGGNVEKRAAGSKWKIDLGAVGFRMPT